MFHVPYYTHDLQPAFRLGTFREIVDPLPDGVPDRPILLCRTLVDYGNWQGSLAISLRELAPANQSNADCAEIAGSDNPLVSDWFVQKFRTHRPSLNVEAVVLVVSLQRQ